MNILVTKVVNFIIISLLVVGSSLCHIFYHSRIKRSNTGNLAESH